MMSTTRAPIRPVVSPSPGRLHARAQPAAAVQPMLCSLVMRRLDRTLRAVAPKDVGISLVGESGTGKEVLARLIHELSPRRAKPFVPINCAAVPEALFESELFGHEKGAFTGATERMKGKIEPANGGTLFLDEIADMPFAMQGKMLRFLENQKFMRVGGAEKISVDVRIICATSRPLEEEVTARRFRSDLYYRVQGIRLDVPPLRDRRADLQPLVEEILAQLCAKHACAPVHLSRRALSALRSYGWPGNIRELRNVLERVAVLRAGKSVRLEDLPPALRQGPEQPARGEPSASIQIPLDQHLRISMSQIIEAALRLDGGNRSHAARRLGVSTRTIQRHLKS